MPQGTPFPTISSNIQMPQTLKEHLEYGIALKEEGNLYFKTKDYQGAIKKYAKVRAFLKPLVHVEGQDQEQFVRMIADKNGDSGLTK